jgi:8-oxo-dGTP diphosphatase
MVSNPALQRAVCGVVLYVEDGRVLLQQRDNKPSIPYPGWWTFFGGAVEDGERPDEAIVRELREELELTQTVTFWFDYECPVRTQPGVVTTRNYMFVAQLTVPLEALTLREGQSMRLWSKAAARDLELAYEQTYVLRAFFDRFVGNP